MERNPSPLGVLEHIPAEQCEINYVNYGKLVASAHEQVTSGIGVTRRSAGVEKDFFSQLRTNVLLGITSADLAVLTPENEKYGGLILKSISDKVAVSRFRFRPELGEGKEGRRHQQATALLVPKEFLQRNFSHLARGFAQLRAIPDLDSVPDKERFDVRSMRVQTPAHDIVRYENLDEDARRIADALRTMTDKGVVIPKETFENEEKFLTTLGKAVETIKPQDLRVTSGVAKLQGPWLQYNIGS